LIDIPFDVALLALLSDPMTEEIVQLSVGACAF